MPAVPEDGCGADIHARIEKAALEEAELQAKFKAKQQQQQQQQQESEDTVCCGCRPKGRRWQRKSNRAPVFSAGTGTAVGSAVGGGGRKTESVYDDAQLGDVEDWKSMADSQYFFDAVEQELGPDEYPIFITNRPPSAPKFVTLEQPETLLLHNYEDDRTDATGAGGGGGASSTIVVGSEEVINHQHKQSSMRLQRILRRGTMEHQQQLESPRVKVPLRGYPGELTKPELEQCVRFFPQCSCCVVKCMFSHALAFALCYFCAS
jgi:hypothetical protein